MANKILKTATVREIDGDIMLVTTGTSVIDLDSGQQIVHRVDEKGFAGDDKADAIDKATTYAANFLKAVDPDA